MRATIGLLIFIGLMTQAAHAAPEPVPYVSAFTGWTDNKDYDDDVLNIAALPSVSLCAGQYLYPAHPQQDLKRYHGGLWGDYDLAKVRGDDSICLTQFQRNSAGIRYCGRADSANYVVLSDVFTDGCGHLVRGFVEVQFMTSEESMGTLISPGRTMYPNPKSDYAGDMQAGGTYPVPRTKFMKITPTFQSDIAATAALRAKAQSLGYTLSSVSQTYTEPK